MLKRLLATTAIVALASSAYAAGTTNQTGSAMNAPSINYLSKVHASDALATKLIGQAVYSGASNGNAPSGTNDARQANPEHIGDINDLIVGQNGSVDAVIIGVGGFLGVGEKNVAVPFDSLHWSMDNNGKPAVFLAVTKDQLQNAPNFDVATLQQNPKGNAGNSDTAMNAPAAGTTDKGVTAYGTQNTVIVDTTNISADELKNTTVYDADNQNVGNVGDVIVTKDGKIDAIIVDVGGFLGIGEKPVAIAFEDLKIHKAQDGKLIASTSFTKEQLDNAPKYDKNAYQDQRDQMRLHTQG
jgi:sporulation protein YlmC with PRC-barrel domain